MSTTAQIVLLCFMLVMDGVVIVWICSGSRAAKSQPTAVRPAASDPLPAGDIKTGPGEVELIVAVRPEGPADNDTGQVHDLMALTVSAAPSARYVYGDASHSISVVVRSAEVDALREALKEICTVETFVPLSQRN